MPALPDCVALVARPDRGIGVSKGHDADHSPERKSRKTGRRGKGFPQRDTWIHRKITSYSPVVLSLKYDLPNLFRATCFGKTIGCGKNLDVPRTYSQRGDVLPFFGAMLKEVNNFFVKSGEHLFDSGT